MSKENKTAGAQVKIHNGKVVLETLSNAVQKSWKRSKEMGISRKNVLPEKVSEAEFERIKIETKRIYTLGSSIVTRHLSDSGIDCLGGLIFDKNGCLLCIHGSDDFQMWAKAQHFIVSSMWNEAAIGTSAVSLGLDELVPVSLKGDENYAEFLHGGNYAFCPIKLDNGEVLGGLLLVAPKEVRVENLLQMSIAFVRTIELQFFWFSTVIETGDVTEGTGILFIDQSNNQNRILVFSDEAIRILGLPEMDYFYDHLENIVEDIPENKKFWDMIRKETKVFDEEVTLKVRGKNVVTSISLTSMTEERFHLRGKNIRMDSIKRINKLVSRYAGNTARYTFNDFLGDSPPVNDLLEKTKTAARTHSNILLLGESGVGKDILAQAIHSHSQRKDRPFVAVNCAAFSKELIASEIFGYESGAFTGARKEGAIGKFELAQNGTLFLDEIGDMPLDLQAMLLRVLEEKRFMRVGGNRVIEVDVRIVAATNADLHQKIADGLFREDLFYRLGVIRVNIPPLRERGDDIILLSNYFMDQVCQRFGRCDARLSDSAKSFMKSYIWPGNVRELQNLLEGILSTTNDDLIEVDTILKYLGYSEAAGAAGDVVQTLPAHMAAPGIEKYDERSAMIEALREHNNNKTQAAASMDMPISTFYRRLKRYGLF